MRAQSGLPLEPWRRTASPRRASGRRRAWWLSATSSLPPINPRPRASPTSRYRRSRFRPSRTAASVSPLYPRCGRARGSRVRRPRPGMTRISKAMAEGADLSAFVDQRLILARGQPARLLTRPPVGRLAMWPGPPGDPIRLKRPRPREGSRTTATQAGVQRRAIPVRWWNGFAQKIG
jgi:hypothetical protein